MSSFAENQLKKYGWTKGQGLGKNAEGRKTPIVITKKNDTHGLGGNSEDWSFEWWNKVYTKTLDNIKVSKASDGEIKVSKMIKESTIPRNHMGIISTSESLYSLSDSYNSTAPASATTSSSSDNELTHRSRFDVDENESSSPSMSLFYYGNFIKSSTGPLDLNGCNKPSKKMKVNESKSKEEEKNLLLFATTNNCDMLQDEEKQDEKQKQENSKKKATLAKKEKRDKKKKEKKISKIDIHKSKRIKDR